MQNTAWRIISKVISAVILIAILSCALIGCAGQVASEPMDYLLLDMSKYATVDTDAYRGKTIKISVAPVTDLDVEKNVLSVLRDYRGSVAEIGAITGAIYPGDEVTLWQRGYIIDENGFEWDFSGGSNIASGSATTITIGDGSESAKGIESALVGVDPSDYGRFNTLHKIKEGEILDTDVVYLTTQCYYETGRTIQGTLRIDLRRDDVEAQYGEGIIEYIKGLEFGEVKYSKDSFTLKGSDDHVSYVSIRLDYVTRCENNPYVIEARFSDDYDEETLAGKTVYFDTYIKCVKHYDRQPVLDDKFILEDLKLTAEDLAEYAGETLADKYRSAIRAGLEAQRESNIAYAVEDQIFAILLDTVEFKKLPKAEINRLIEEYIVEYRLSYASTQGDVLTMYESFDDYMISNMLMSGFIEEGDEDWRSALEASVETEVKEKIALFAVIQEEDLILTDEEYAEKYRNFLVNGFATDSAGGVREDYKSDEEFEKALSTYEARMINYYGELGI